MEVSETSKSIEKGTFFIAHDGGLYLALVDFELPETEEGSNDAYLRFLIDYKTPYVCNLEDAGLIREVPYVRLEFYTEDGPLFRG